MHPIENMYREHFYEVESGISLIFFPFQNAILKFVVSISPLLQMGYLTNNHSR